MEPVAASDYHGALVVAETDAGEIVLIHPPDGTPDAPGSLPSNPYEPSERPEQGAVRIVRELTGLDVVITAEFITFIQHGTPTGTMCAHGYTAHVVGGSLLDHGPKAGSRLPAGCAAEDHADQGGQPACPRRLPRTAHRRPCRLMIAIWRC
jgi:ADP-ribose pyrophosphatase YjhB (NUDIX family)